MTSLPVHINYTSVPASSPDVILGTDIYTYEHGPATYSETAIPSTPTTSAAPQQNIRPTLGVIISHPYPPLGGSKSDPVIRLLATKFVEQFRKNVVVYAFNFRGVTTRTSWTSNKEQADLMAVASSLIDSYSGVKTILLTGYSYGALIAAKADVSALKNSSGISIAYMLLSPPLWPVSAAITFTMRPKSSEPQLAYLTEPYTGSVDGTVLVVYGTRDNFTTERKYHKWTAIQLDQVKEQLQGHKYENESLPAQVVEIPHGPHFWKPKEINNKLWTNPQVLAFLEGLVSERSRFELDSPSPSPSPR
ncbi:Alpha/Beta hydrolase protein [Lipomyces arxii]|uniref:Alpha/Beta hydrolase protein n=1 Tax=Lipomyces arxii TaxID=56418 RepID=UPI0034CE204C